MSTKTPFGEEVSGAEQEPNKHEERWSVEESPDLRPSVEQEIQATVDTNHPDATPSGLTLAEEERWNAWEWEIERTRARFDRRQDSDREARSRRAATQMSSEWQRTFAKRRASVDPWADPDRIDPREQLSRAELGAVNREAMRLAEQLPRWSRSKLSRRLAERVVDGNDVASAVIGVFEELRWAPGQVIPIAAVGEVSRREVDICGEIAVLWEPSHPAIAQVGLIEDETGQTRFTAWKRSGVPSVREGEQVVFRTVATNWYQGRVSVALTGRSTIAFPERERWWAE
ncbi:DNA-binding protein [Haloplanus aerogenes]|nr:DNA-binding protein [Haloplanus aerogenes]AZH24779.1 DNA-binding protein [Haloplanus aerogenes]